ncbi:FKBP-type peptidyl-prolyl cis-trans isomerase [Wenyingzhuangia sp. IMCC45574]
MNIIKGLALGLVVAGMVSCNQQNAARKTSLATEQDSVSYALGAYINLNFRVSEEFKDLDYAVLNQAMREATDTSKTLLSQKEITPILIAYTKKQAELKNAKYKRDVTEFATVDESIEVQTTESGLKYQVVKEGTGNKPVATNTVKVHYHGTNPSGEVFDSSVERSTPAEFPLNGVIKGWTEGLQLMSVGSKYKFIIPAELAYGAQSPSPKIPANSELTFVVELLEIVK